MSTPRASQETIRKRQREPVLGEEIRRGRFPKRTRIVGLVEAIDDDDQDDYGEVSKKRGPHGE